MDFIKWLLKWALILATIYVVLLFFGFLFDLFPTFTFGLFVIFILYAIYSYNKTTVDENEEDDE